MKRPQPSASRRLVMLTLVGLCGVAAALAAMTSLPIPPGAAQVATLVGCIALTAATLPPAARTLGGPLCDRSLIVCGIILVCVAGVLLPRASVDITWGRGPRAGDMARPFLANAWGNSNTAYELHAPPNNPAGRDNWFYELYYDLTTLPTRTAHRVYFSFTRQEGDQLDASGKPLSLKSPVRFTIHSVDPPSSERLLEAAAVPPPLEPNAPFDWQRASFEVPAGTRRLLIAVEPLAPQGGDAPARIWLAFQPPQPIVGKLKVTELIERGARGLAATWLYAVAAYVQVALRTRLKRAPCGDRAAGTYPALSADAGGVLMLTVAAVALLLYFAPVISVHAMSDDFAFFQTAHEDPGALYKSMTGCGRYISATMLHLAFLPVTCLADFSYLRAAGALALAASAALLARHLLRCGWAPSHALAIALLVATTPSAALAVGWTQEFTKPFALLLCAGAFGIISPTLADGRRVIVRALAAAAVLSCAFLIHQSNGTYFIVLIAISAWASLERESLWPVLLRARWAAGAFAVAMLVALAAVKLNPAPVERAALMSSPLAKLAWFFTVPLVNVSTLAVLPSLPVATAVVATIVVLGLLVLLGQGRFRAAAGMLLLFVLLPVTYAPTLAVAENWPSFRSLFCVYALAVFIVAVALRSIVGSGRHVLTLLLILATTASLAVFARQTRVRLTQPAAIETRVLKEAIGHIDTAQVKRLHLIGPHWTQSASNEVWYDEFGFPTSSHFWSVDHLVYTMSRELPAAQRDALMALEFTWGPPLQNAPPEVAQVDMRELAYWRQANR